MTFPTSRQTDSAERVAEQVDSVISRMVDYVQAMRNQVNTNEEINGNQLRELYMQVAAAITFVNDKGGVSGINDAYKRRFTSLPSNFNAATEWTTTARPALVSFRNWMGANIPQASGNRLAFVEVSGTGELTPYTLVIAGATKTAFLAECDACLAAFS